MGFVKSMELAERYEGVKVVTICPGAVDSPLWSDEKRKQVNFEQFEKLTPDDVAKVMIDVSDSPDDRDVLHCVNRPTQLVQDGKYGGGTAIEIMPNNGPKTRVIPKWNIDPPQGGSTSNVDASKEVPHAFREAKRVMDEERGTAKK